MPVKNTKRNGINHKHNNEPNQIMYSTSLPSQYGDTPITSAASSPPDHPAFSPDPIPPDQEPEGVRETMTHFMDPVDSPVGYMEDIIHTRDTMGELDHDAPAVLPVSVMCPTASPYPSGERLLVDLAASVEPGHIRSPMLAREPTALESFSRTLRGYVPSSIPIPSVTPTPPRVSRPVSFGNFLTPSSPVTQHPMAGRSLDGPPSNSKRRGSDVSADVRREQWRQQVASVSDLDEAVFNLDEEVQGDSVPLSMSQAKYPTMDNVEEITWAAWDQINDAGGSHPRRVLMLGYATGLQIWDCSDLSAVSEILNLSGHQWRAEQIAILPAPRTLVSDELAAKRPLIGIMIGGEEHEFVVYSLRQHEIVHRISLPSLASFSVSPDFIVLSTAQPAALHILSAWNFRTLDTISPSLMTFAHPSETPTNVSLPDIDHHDGAHHLSSSTIPRPIFALSHRLLAFTSRPSQHDTLAQTSRQPRTATPSSDDSSLRLPSYISQADLGSAAIKIGGTVLSGMKALGGMAFSAARAGVTAAVADAGRSTSGTHSPGRAQFFSRSAPAATGRSPESKYSHFSGSDVGSNMDGYTRVSPPRPPPSAAPPEAGNSKGAGYHVTVVDLAPLLGTKAAKEPLVVTEFVAFKHQPVSGISFSPDGTSLVVVPRDGQILKVYKLHPKRRGKRFRPWRPSGTQKDSRETFSNPSLSNSVSVPPWHIYDLRRGRTSAIVEGIEWSHDGRWLAISTQRRQTVHIFPLNPYGGFPDIRSHLEGHVVNATDNAPLSVELTPLVQLRSSKPPTTSLTPVFTFLRATSPIPSSLLPQGPKQSPPPSSSPTSTPFNSSHPNASSNHQDLLLFEPQEGLLSLRRVMLSARPKERPLSISAVPLTGTSISLPGMSTMGNRVSAISESPTQPSGLTRMMERPLALVGQESTVARWMLRRGRDWNEVKSVVHATEVTPSTSRLPRSDWLSQAELSTATKSRRLAPRSIYLRHQFFFCFLGEDYHALIRSYHFDVPAHRVEVRKQVEVSPSSTAIGESFVQGSLSSQPGISSSFDEPLASALSANIKSLTPSPPVLPMYPNGSTSRSIRPAIPIRHVAAGITDGMSEGFGRLRRELAKARSPRSTPRGAVSASVPLEFDEEDEDFASVPAEGSDSVSRSDSREAASVSTPSTGIEPLPMENEGDGAWQGWGLEDKQAIEEFEQFDDISAAGFMDEELGQTARR